jgi:glycosyltransferase involved in cell wall biosynthesis
VAGEFGILIKPGDLKSCRDAILTMQDEKVRYNFVKVGKELVWKYNWENLAKEYVGIYEGAIVK